MSWVRASIEPSVLLLAAAGLYAVFSLSYLVVEAVVWYGDLPLLPLTVESADVWCCDDDVDVLIAIEGLREGAPE